MQKLRLHGKEVTKNVANLSGSRSHRGSMMSLPVKGFAESSVIRTQHGFTIDKLPKFQETVMLNATSIYEAFTFRKSIRTK